VILLGENEVHVWWAFPDLVLAPELLRRQFLTLSAAEQGRHDGFRFDRHRRQFLVSHSLVRDVLSHYAPVPPSEWRFRVSEYGWPSVAWNGASPLDLRFNLSHTEGRSIVAVARGVDIGVDVESTASGRGVSGIAERYFSAAEIAQLSQHPEWFFDFWTLKEAYIKARGFGLAIPLNSFSFSLANPDRPAVSFHGECEDRPDRWHFVLDRGSDYRMALAAATDTCQPLRIVEREVVPLAEVRHVREYRA
jgi:4'-phosphopantetheinyl transferase